MNRLENWTIKNTAWIIMGQLVVTLLLLGAITTITLINQGNISDLQAKNLRDTRTVVRCATNQTVVGLQRVIDKLGVRIRLEVPNTKGIDCALVLNIPLVQEDLPNGH